MRGHDYYIKEEMTSNGASIICEGQMIFLGIRQNATSKLGKYLHCTFLLHGYLPKLIPRHLAAATT